MKKFTRFFSVITFTLTSFASTAVDASAQMGPLTRSASNPNYFARPDGTPVYLTGSHHWSNLQDEGATFPPAPFDYAGYLNWMQSNKYNFMRLWFFETPYGAAWLSSPWYYDPLPFARTGPGLAADGKPRFDVTKLNQAYFDRMRQRVIAGQQKGIYMAIMLFEGWSIESKSLSTNPWLYHPFRAGNNINGINGDPSNTGNGITTHTTNAPAAVLAAQQAYVRKVIDTVNDLENVLYEISNESHTVSAQWQYNMIKYIRDYQAGKPKQHPIGMTAVGSPGSDFSNFYMFNSSADWVSPSSADNYKEDPPANNGSKVVLIDTDHIWGAGGDMWWVWKSFTRGLNPIFMDDLEYTGVYYGSDVITPIPYTSLFYTTRTGMTQTANYATRMDLRTAKPNGNLTSTGYMLANPGVQYLVFAPSGGSFTVNLSAGSDSNFSVEWFNITTGATTMGNPVAGGSSQQAFTPPFSGSAVLFLNKVSGITVSRKRRSENPSLRRPGGPVAPE